MVLDIVKHSENLNDIVMSKEVRDAMIGLRSLCLREFMKNQIRRKKKTRSRISLVRYMSII